MTAWTFHSTFHLKPEKNSSHTCNAAFSSLIDFCERGRTFTFTSTCWQNLFRIEMRRSAVFRKSLNSCVLSMRKGCNLSWRVSIGTTFVQAVCVLNQLPYQVCTKTYSMLEPSLLLHPEILRKIRHQVLNRQHTDYFFLLGNGQVTNLVFMHKLVCFLNRKITVH